MVQLEELNMDDISNNWDNEGIKNASLIEVKNLPQLRALHLHVLDACVLRKGMFDSGNLRRYNIKVGNYYFDTPRSSRLLQLALHEQNQLYEYGFQMFD